MGLEGEGCVGEIEGFGYGFIDNFAVDDVYSFCEPRIFAAGFFPAEGGKTKCVGESGIGKGEGRGLFHSSRYICYCVLDNPVYLKCGFGMSCRMGGLETASLVNGYIDHHRAGAHHFHHVACYEMRRFSPGNKHGPDDEIGSG